MNVPYGAEKKSNTPPYPLMSEAGEERCIVHEKWKLILSTVRSPELYDLETDPLEKQNLWGGEAYLQIIDSLKEYLSEWAQKTNDELAPQLLQSLSTKNGQRETKRPFPDYPTNDYPTNDYTTVCLIGSAT
jgi:arylsulfatase A-like enzyme